MKTRARRILTPEERSLRKKHALIRTLVIDVLVIIVSKKWVILHPGGLQGCLRNLCFKRQFSRKIRLSYPKAVEAFRKNYSS